MYRFECEKLDCPRGWESDPRIFFMATAYPSFDQGCERMTALPAAGTSEQGAFSKVRFKDSVGLFVEDSGMKDSTTIED